MGSEHVESWFFLPKRHAKAQVVTAIRAAGFSVRADPSGIVALRVEDLQLPNLEDVLELFQPIARFVRQDSFVVWRQNGERREIVFRQKRVRKGYGHQPENIRGGYLSKARKKRTPLARALAILRTLTTIEVGSDESERGFVDDVWEVLLSRLADAKKWKELAAECARAPARLRAIENHASYLLYELKDHDAAIDLARRDPENQSCLEILLRAYLDTQRYEEALPIARKVEDRKAERWILFSLARYEEALAIPHADDDHRVIACLSSQRTTSRSSRAASRGSPRTSPSVPSRRSRPPSFWSPWSSTPVFISRAR